MFYSRTDFKFNARWCPLNCLMILSPATCGAAVLKREDESSESAVPGGIGRNNGIKKHFCYPRKRQTWEAGSSNSVSGTMSQR